MMTVPARKKAEIRALLVPYRKIIYFLFLTVATLVLFHLIGQYGRYGLGYRDMFGFVELFHLDRERNIPTFFSALLLLFSAILLVSIYWFMAKGEQHDRRYWLLLAILFLGLSVDESCSLHERLIDPVRAVVGVNPWFYYAWIIPAGIFLVGLGIYLIGFLWRLPTDTRIRFLVAGTIYVGGAIGIEIVGGYYVFFHDKDTLSYNLIAAVEETMEMIGVVLFIRALFIYMHHHLWNEVVIHLQE